MHKFIKTLIGRKYYERIYGIYKSIDACTLNKLMDEYENGLYKDNTIKKIIQ